jgi:tRNA (guanosine-2'-O-)-methyltransferase
MSVELINYLSGFVNKRRLENFENVLSYRTRYISLVCEDIYQSHNASALIRTCDCFGIQDFHIIEKRNLFKVNSEIALGASNWLTINRYSNAGDNVHSLFAGLRDRGCRLVATTPRKHGVSLSEFKIEKGPFCLLFGTEKEGLSAGILDEADEFVSIDMYGFTKSLNVSVSAGIILHHLRMKLNAANIRWQLSDNEKMIIKLDWLRKSIKRSELIEKDFTDKKNNS